MIDRPADAKDERLTPLAADWASCEQTWNGFLGRAYPGAVCVRWSPWHRVFRHHDRAVKIQRLDALPNDPTQHVRQECELLDALEGRVWTLNPAYREIDGAWAVLEMDWVDGEDLEWLMRQGRAREMSVLRAIRVLIGMGLAGVAHRQFRARHLIRRHRDGAVFAIDLGGSRRTTRWRALRENLAPLARTNRGWRISGNAAVLWRLARGKGVSSDDERRRLDRETASRRWRDNRRRRPEMRAVALSDAVADSEVRRRFERMESAFQAAISSDAELAAETWKIQVDSYVQFGARDWGLFWERVLASVDLARLRVVDLSAGQGFTGAFAVLHGAASACVLDARSEFLSGARAFAEALGVNAVECRCADLADLCEGGEQMPSADLAFLIGARAGALRESQTIALIGGYPRVVLEIDPRDGVGSALAGHGFTRIERLCSSIGDRWFVLAEQGGDG